MSGCCPEQGGLRQLRLAAQAGQGFFAHSYLAAAPPLPLPPAPPRAPALAELLIIPRNRNSQGLLWSLEDTWPPDSSNLPSLLRFRREPPSPKGAG